MNDKGRDKLSPVVDRIIDMRGRGLFLSPVDTLLIMNWLEDGVPGKLIIEALDRGIEVLKEKKRDIRNISVSRLKSFIEREIKNFVKRGAISPSTIEADVREGKKGEEGASGRLLKIVKRVLSKVEKMRKRFDEDWVAIPYNDFIAGLTEIHQALEKKGEERGAGHIIDRLYEMRVKFYEDLMEKLPEKEREEFSHRARSMMEEMGFTLSGKDKGVFDGMMKRILSRRFPLFDHGDILLTDEEG